MPCYKPNYMHTIKVQPSIWHNPPQGMKFQKDKPIWYEFIPHSKLKGVWYMDKINGTMPEGHDLQSIPCGQCIGCRLDYSRDWANRCFLETTEHEYNWFITLSYNDDNLIKGPLGNPTLKPEDLELFMKRLREYYRRTYNHEGIKFYAAGEYGETTFRPHYHAIIFNLPIPDITTNFESIDTDGSIAITQHQTGGNVYYWSELIQNIWGKGNIVIGKADWKSCAYTARYIMKKQKGEGQSAYKKLGIEPEFVRMSRRPGLGEKYFKDNYGNIYWKDNLVIYNGGPKTIAPPRYFDKLLSKLEGGEEWLEFAKRNRQEKQNSRNITEYKIIQTDSNKLNKHKLQIKTVQLNTLKRHI